MQTARLFFALDIEAPWPDDWPEGRVLAEPDRHETLAFLGNVEENKIPDLLAGCPVPSCPLAPSGQFDQCLLLPKENPRLAAWHLMWSRPIIPLFQKTLAEWLKGRQIVFSEKPWLSHVTISRAPLDKKTWVQMFEPLPCYAKGFHLFKSLGQSKYLSLWSKPFHPPFRETEHTADMSFLIYGEDLASLYNHAILALSFKYPPFFLYEKTSFSSLEDVVIALNQRVSDVDRELGCPFKAVSFHGEVQKIENKLLSWEMIVDV